MMLPVVGSSVWVDNQKRTVTRLFKNVNGEIVLEWHSKHNVGGCIISIWNEWKDGVDLEENRARAACVCTKNFVVEVIRKTRSHLQAVAARIQVKAVTKKEALDKIQKRYPNEKLRVFYARR